MDSWKTRKLQGEKGEKYKNDKGKKNRTNDWTTLFEAYITYLHTFMITI